MEESGQVYRTYGRFISGGGGNQWVTEYTPSCASEQRWTFRKTGNSVVK